MNQNATLATVTSRDGTTIAYERTGSGPAVVLVCGGSTDRGVERRSGGRPVGHQHGLQLRSSGPRRQRRHAAVRGRAGDRGHRRRHRGDRRAGRPLRHLVGRRARPPRGRGARLDRPEARHLGGSVLRRSGPAPAARYRRAVPQAARRRPSGGGGRVLHGGGRPAAKGVRRVREDPAVLRGPGEDRPHARVRRPVHGRLPDPDRRCGSRDVAVARDRRRGRLPADGRRGTRPGRGDPERRASGISKARATTWIRPSSERCSPSSSPPDPRTTRAGARPSAGASACPGDAVRRSGRGPAAPP